MRSSAHEHECSNKPSQSPTCFDTRGLDSCTICASCIAILYKTGAEFLDEKDLVNYFSKKLMLRLQQLREIFNERSTQEKQMEERDGEA